MMRSQNKKKSGSVSLFSHDESVIDEKPLLCDDDTANIIVRTPMINTHQIVWCDGARHLIGIKYHGVNMQIWKEIGQIYFKTLTHYALRCMKKNSTRNKETRRRLKNQTRNIYK